MVITGFEINDILASICKIVEMKNKCENELVNLYSRFVKKEGNINAINIIYEVFKGDLIHISGDDGTPPGGCADFIGGIKE